MKSIQFYADTNRSDNLLHIETDGAIINIHVGLCDAQGRRVTRIIVSPEDESRGGDGQGYIWGTPDGPIGGRIVRQENCDECGATIPDGEPSSFSAHHREPCSLHPSNMV